MAAKLKTKMKVKFGGPGRNKNSRRLSVTVPFTALKGDLEELHALITGAQLEAQLTCDPNAGKDGEGQKVMPLASSKVKPLDLIVDCRGFSVRFDSASFSLKLPIDTKAQDVDAFAFREGTLTLTRTGDAAAEEGDGDVE